jgi:hypothetical protein
MAVGGQDGLFGKGILLYPKEKNEVRIAVFVFGY